MTRKIIQPISLTNDSLTLSEKQKNFKTLGYRNQTDYIKRTGVPKNQLIDTVVSQYNDAIVHLNVTNIKKKKTLSRPKLYRLAINLSKRLGFDDNYYKKIYKDMISKKNNLKDRSQA